MANTVAENESQENLDSHSGDLSGWRSRRIGAASHEVPIQLLNLFDYERAAAERIEARAFEYYSGGSADNLTLRGNRAAFDRLRLLPSVLNDVSDLDLSTTVLGRSESMPIIIAPTAMARLADESGERAIAGAAKAEGITQVLSSLSTYSIEEVAEVGGNTWFQLYVFRDRGITEHLVARAEAAGYQAIVLTVDLAVPGLRENIVRVGFDPSDLVLSNFVEVMRGRQENGFLEYVNENFDPSLTWADVEWLRSITKLPILVKGVLRVDDARRAVAAGVSGIIVSNHGGRQLDTVVAGIDALPAVVVAVGGRCEVFVDGGIRRGTDVVKALALGARAVLVGRPVLWGLAVGGEAGVADVLGILRAELANAMALCGAASVKELPDDLVV